MGNIRKFQASEHAEQKAFVKWCRNRGLLIYAIPNGGVRDAVQGKRLKDEGVLAGIPDLQIVLTGGKVLWIEMKTRTGGTVSAKQKYIHNLLAQLGHEVFVARGAKEAVNFIQKKLDSQQDVVSM